MMTDRPKALDLFCGAGGAAMGLHRAGFEVTGVDLAPQPRYPFTFVQGDALAPPLGLAGFDLIWASPVCKGFSTASSSWRQSGREYPNQIPQTRELLASAGGALTVIENVPRAPLRPDIILDGTMFPHLTVIRRRHFETNFPVALRLGFDARGFVRYRGWSTVVGGGRMSGVPRAANAWHTNAAKRKAMGIDWMTREELAQAIPPAYAEYIGCLALRHLGERIRAFEDAVG